MPDLQGEGDDMLSKRITSAVLFTVLPALSLTLLLVGFAATVNLTLLAIDRRLHRRV